MTHNEFIITSFHFTCLVSWLVVDVSSITMTISLHVALSSAAIYNFLNLRFLQHCLVFVYYASPPPSWSIHNSYRIVFKRPNKREIETYQYHFNFLLFTAVRSSSNWPIIARSLWRAFIENSIRLTDIYARM